MDIIRLTARQAEQYDNGKIKSKRLFLKVVNTEEFDLYLLRYCKIVKTERNDFYRVWYFNEFGYNIELTYYLGEYHSIKWYKDNL